MLILEVVMGEAFVFAVRARTSILCFPSCLLVFAGGVGGLELNDLSLSLSLRLCMSVCLAFTNSIATNSAEYVLVRIVVLFRGQSRACARFFGVHRCVGPSCSLFRFFVGGTALVNDVGVWSSCCEWK